HSQKSTTWQAEAEVVPEAWPILAGGAVVQACALGGRETTQGRRETTRPRRPTWRCDDGEAKPRAEIKLSNSPWFGLPAFPRAPRQRLNTMASALWAVSRGPAPKPDGHQQGPCSGQACLEGVPRPAGRRFPRTETGLRTAGSN